MMLHGGEKNHVCNTDADITRLTKERTKEQLYVD